MLNMSNYWPLKVCTYKDETNLAFGFGVVISGSILDDYPSLYDIWNGSECSSCVASIYEMTRY